MVTFKNTNFIDSEDLIHESLTRSTILNTILKMYPQEILKEYSFVGAYFSLFNLLNMISKEEQIDVIINEFDNEIVLEIVKGEYTLTRACIKNEFVNKTKEKCFCLFNTTKNNNKMRLKQIDSKK